MSWLSKGIKGLGHVLAKPVAIGARALGTAGGFVVGGPAGAMAGYRLGDKIGNIEEDALAGRNVRTHLAGNLIGAAEGGAGLYGSSKIPSAGDSASAIPGGGTADPYSDPTGDALYGSDPALGGSGGASGPSYLNRALDAGKTLLPGQGGQPGQSGASSTNPWLLGLAGLEGANSAYLGKKANDYSQGALKSVQGAYNDRAPLRAAALKGLTNPTAPDISTLKSIASRNPYAVQ
jgi:hypothetical protein